MKNLFLDIEAHIMAMANTPFKYVQQYNGQFDDFQEGKTYDFPKPAVLIEFQSPQPIGTLGDRTIIHDPLTVRLHIVQELLDAGNGTMDRNLSIEDLKDLLFNAFHLFEPDKAVAFTLLAENRDTNHTNIYHFIQDYATNYVQEMTNDLVSKAPPIALIVTPDTAP